MAFNLRPLVGVHHVVDHQILGVHHVRDDLGGPIAWDIGFLLSGVLLIAVVAIKGFKVDLTGRKG